MPAPLMTEAEASPRAISVLFADDSAAMRTLARYALSARHGFQVVAEAENGAQVLNLLNKHEPDCVVMDIEMPGVNGITALTELTERHPDLPVVMLSGTSDQETTQQAMALGAAAYVEKGDLARLSETIREVIRIYRTRSAEARPAALMPKVEVAGVSAGPALATAAADLRRLEYVVGHDFAEPARVMAGFSHLLQNHYRDVLDERGQGFLEQICSAADRLQHMIDDLLLYGRAAEEAARQDLLDVAGRFAFARRQLTQKIEARHAQLSVGVLPKAVGDPGMMATVFEQVLDNALTFNRNPLPWVDVQGRIDGEEAIYTITDNGIGVSPGQADEVFELGRRLNTRDEFPGTGTGLALCRRLMTLQNGTISLRSPAEGGSVVTLTLPAYLDQ